MFNLRAFLGLTFYTSELDQFLKNYDKNHPKLTAAQTAEKTKYERIYRLRDKALNVTKRATSLWERF